MDEHQIPEELKDYIEEGEGVSTPFTEEIHFIFSNLIKEDFRINEKKNIGEIKGANDTPKKFKKTASNYNPLGFKITDEFKKPLDYVKGSFLKSLCFPTGKELIYGRTKELLILTYTYLNDHLPNKDGKKPGRYFIDRLKGKNLENDKIIRLENWIATTNFTAFQWCSFLRISQPDHLIRRVKCVVKTNSEFYRFGFKLFRKNGRLFGDGGIQSSDNNMIIHFGKNQSSDELFFTSYKNAVRQHLDKYLNEKQPALGTPVELYIDDENFLHFHVNGKEIYNMFINKEVRHQAYMLVWADTHEYQVNVDDIEILLE